LCGNGKGEPSPVGTVSVPDRVAWLRTPNQDRNDGVDKSHSHSTAAVPFPRPAARTEGCS
jgi:hypothetical protein